MTKQRQIEEEIEWSIKQMEPHVWCFNTLVPEFARELHDKVNTILWSYDIEPLYTMQDESMGRYMTLIDIDPHWAFIAKVIPDKWDYRKELEDIANVYR